MAFDTAILSGLAGAATVTVLNESVRRAAPEIAPRMEILGMRALKAGFEAADAEVPPRRGLIKLAFGGEVASNTAYYSLVGMARPENAVAVGAALGLAAGLGAVLLPGPMGLGNEPSTRTPGTAAMTVAWYFAGGLVAGLAARAIGGGDERS
jgi:hypothetical protein